MERGREKESRAVRDEERGRRSIIVINTITINAPETAVRSRESTWIPFTPLLSRPSFSGYITTSGNPLFGKFFGFPRRVCVRSRACAFSRFISFRGCLPVLSSSMSRGSGRIHTAGIPMFAVICDRQYGFVDTRRSLVVSYRFLSRLVCDFCVVPRASYHNEYSAIANSFCTSNQEK